MHCRFEASKKHVLRYGPKNIPIFKGHSCIGLISLRHLEGIAIHRIKLSIVAEATHFLKETKKNETEKHTLVETVTRKERVLHPNEELSVPVLIHVPLDRSLSRLVGKFYVGIRYYLHLEVKKPNTTFRHGDKFFGTFPIFFEEEYPEAVFFRTIAGKERTLNERLVLRKANIQSLQTENGDFRETEKIQIQKAPKQSINLLDAEHPFFENCKDSQENQLDAGTNLGDFLTPFDQPSQEQQQFGDQDQILAQPPWEDLSSPFDWLKTGDLAPTNKGLFSEFSTEFGRTSDPKNDNLERAQTQDAEKKVPDSEPNQEVLLEDPVDWKYDLSFREAVLPEVRSVYDLCYRPQQCDLVGPQYGTEEGAVLVRTNILDLFGNKLLLSMAINSQGILKGMIMPLFLNHAEPDTLISGIFAGVSVEHSRKDDENIFCGDYQPQCVTSTPLEIGEPCRFQFFLSKLFTREFENIVCTESLRISFHCMAGGDPFHKRFLLGTKFSDSVK